MDFGKKKEKILVNVNLTLYFGVAKGFN